MIHAYLFLSGTNTDDDDHGMLGGYFDAYCWEAISMFRFQKILKKYRYSSRIYRGFGLFVK